MLLFYFIRMVQYEKMWLKYLPHAEIEKDIVIEQEEVCILDIAAAEILKETFDDKQDWYTTKIAQNYIKSGSLRKLAEKIDVPYRSLGLAVNQFRDKIVRKYNDFEIFMAKNVLNDLPSEAKEKLYLASVKQNSDEKRAPVKLMIGRLVRLHSPGCGKHIHEDGVLPLLW